MVNPLTPGDFSQKRIFGHLGHFEHGYQLNISSNLPKKAFAT